MAGATEHDSTPHSEAVEAGEDMRRYIHDFLRWFPAAVGGGAVAISAVWQPAKDWVASQVVWAWAGMSDPWVAFFIVLTILVYVAAFILTGDKEAKSVGDTHYHYYAPLDEMIEKPPVNHDATGDLVGQGAVIAALADDTLSSTGVTSLHGLYIGYIIASASGLANNRRLDFAIVGYNGTTETIRIADVNGRIRAGVGNMQGYANLATPLFQAVLNAPPHTEFVLEMRQDVSAEQAQEYLEALDRQEHVGLDLRELNIIVASTVTPEKIARLPLWDGINLRRRDDIVSTRNHIISGTATFRISAQGKISNAGKME